MHSNTRQVIRPRSQNQLLHQLRNITSYQRIPPTVFRSNVYINPLARHPSLQSHQHQQATSQAITTTSAFSLTFWNSIPTPFHQSKCSSSPCSFPPSWPPAPPLSLPALAEVTRPLLPPTPPPSLARPAMMETPAPSTAPTSAALVLLSRFSSAVWVCTSPLILGPC